MLKQGQCIFCGEQRQVAPVKNWDDPSKERFYCQDHYFEASSFQDKQKNDFIKTYNEENARKWLSPKNLELYNRLTQK